MYGLWLPSVTANKQTKVTETTWPCLWRRIGGEGPGREENGSNCKSVVVVIVIVGRGRILYKGTHSLSWNSGAGHYPGLGQRLETAPGSHQEHRATCSPGFPAALTGFCLLNPSYRLASKCSVHVAGNDFTVSSHHTLPALFWKEPRMKSHLITPAAHFHDRASDWPVVEWGPVNRRGVRKYKHSCQSPAPVDEGGLLPDRMSWKKAPKVSSRIYNCSSSYSLCCVGVVWVGFEWIIHLEKLLQVHTFLFFHLKQHIILTLLGQKRCQLANGYGRRAPAPWNLNINQNIWRTQFLHHSQRGRANSIIFSSIR